MMSSNVKQINSNFLKPATYCLPKHVKILSLATHINFSQICLKPLNRQTHTKTIEIFNAFGTKMDIKKIRTSSVLFKSLW